MKVLIVPDSYKESLSSQQVCSAIKEGLLQANDNIEITTIPLADGGEGFGECLANICKAEKLYTKCTDIYGKVINAHIYTTKDTAIIECAAASGIQKKKDIMNATSYGTGELIKHAVSKGFSNIILGLGGSGCNDGGAGALSALGVVFKNIYGEIITHPCGKDLDKIFGVNYINSVKGINFTYACDVTNEFYGKNGAAYVFAKQKGATNEDIITLDNGLKQLNAFLPRDVSKVKGAGAAGGLCGGLYSVFGGKITSGFQILSDACQLENKIMNADIIITGEGKTDKQTLMGKLPYRICSLAKKHNKKSIVISGSFQDVTLGDKMISLVDKNTSLEEALKNPYSTLRDKSKFLLQ